MENIDLFDRYINGNLSDNEKNEFDERLKLDKDFSSEFRIYSAVVVGICREAEQDNKDFEEAMKRMSKEDLLVALGDRKEETQGAIRAHTSGFRKLLWQGIGVAALLGLGVIYLVIARNEENPVQSNALAVNQEALDKVDNAIYALSDYSQGVTRSGGIDISTLSDEELIAQLPILELDFRKQTDDMDVAEYGSELAMVYIRIHERDKAKKLLTELITRFQDNGDFQGDVTNWQTILSLLK